MNEILFQIIVVYFAAISVAASAITVADKLLAKKNGKRVPEKLLFILAVFGGSVFEYITMKLIRHKTLHKRFMIGLPVIIILQAAAAVLIILKMKQII